jgi:uroporphyrin-III C-methyltransferase
LAKAQEQSLGDFHDGSNTSIAVNLADTMVYYMGKKDTAKIANDLLRAGKHASTPAAIIESISTPQERIFRTNLDTLANQGANAWLSEDAPAILIIGDVLKDQELPLAIGEFQDRIENQIAFPNSARSA